MHFQRTGTSTFAANATASADTAWASFGVGHSKDPELKALINSYFQERPFSIRFLEIWVSLKVLTNASFGPLGIMNSHEILDLDKYMLYRSPNFKLGICYYGILM